MPASQGRVMKQVFIADVSHKLTVTDGCCLLLAYLPAVMHCHVHV